MFNWKLVIAMSLLGSIVCAVWLLQSHPSAPRSTLVGKSPDSFISPIMVWPPSPREPPTLPVWQERLAQITPRADTKKECLHSNGKWLNGGCVVFTHDSGKACSDHSECEAYCRTSKSVNPGTAPITGICSSAFAFEGGCTQGVSHGKAEVEMCI